MTKRTIGIIGLGSIGMRHAKNLRSLGHHVWGYDPDMSRRLDLGYDYTTSKIEHLKTSDALVIASPTHVHDTHLRDCAGKPIFVEKPIASCHIDDDDVTDVAMVGYNLRFHSCVKKAKEWINQGFLGYPQWANFVCAQFSERPRYLSDGVIFNWSHEIDLALYFLGPAEALTSSTLLSPHDSMTDIILRHKESGCRSVVHLDYLTRPEIRQSIIVGSEATIIMDLHNRQAWLRLLGGHIADHFEGDDSFDENYAEEMEAFIERIDGNRTLGCTAKEALEVLEICLTVRKQAGL